MGVPRALRVPSSEVLLARRHLLGTWPSPAAPGPASTPASVPALSYEKRWRRLWSSPPAPPAKLDSAAAVFTAPSAPPIQVAKLPWFSAIFFVYSCLLDFFFSLLRVFTELLDRTRETSRLVGGSKYIVSEVGFQPLFQNQIRLLG